MRPFLFKKLLWKLNWFVIIDLNISDEEKKLWEKLMLL